MRLIGAAAALLVSATALVVGVSVFGGTATLAQVPGATSTSQDGPAPLDGGLATPFDAGAAQGEAGRSASLDAGRSGSLDRPADSGPAPASSDRAPRPRMVGGSLRSPDRPGVQRAVDPSDGGTTDARTQPTTQPATSEADVNALRARVGALEQQLQNQQAQTELQAATNEQLAALRGQLADAEAQRQSERQGSVQQQQNVQVAMSALNAAQAQLAGGATDLGDALDRASAALTGPARLEVESARAALARSDLYEARQHLAAAIAQAQAAGR